MAKFHTYSFGNIMLIARQRPDATNVAGLRAWNSLGRFVKRTRKRFHSRPDGRRRSTKDVATDEASEDATTEGQPGVIRIPGRLCFRSRVTKAKTYPH